MNKTEIVLSLVIEASGYSTEVLQPGKQPLHLPPAFVSPERSSILCRCFYLIRFMGRDQRPLLVS